MLYLHFLFYISATLFANLTSKENEFISKHFYDLLLRLKLETIMQKLNPHKVVLITGANKGIGYEISFQLGKKGLQVVLTGRDEGKGNTALASLSKLGIKATFIKMDIYNPQSIKEASQEFGKKFDVLDILINNAAVLLDTSKDILELEYEVINQSLKNNTIGSILVTQTFLKFMPNDSRIINISSEAGSLQSMGTYAPAYSISKTALNAATKQFAAALHHRNISVNSVCPGWVRTDMGGHTATRSVQKGAETAVWLATEAPQSLTGKFLRDKKEIDW